MISFVFGLDTIQGNFKELFVALGLSNDLLELYRHSFDYLGDGQAEVSPLHVTSYSLVGRTLRDSRARW